MYELPYTHARCHVRSTRRWSLRFSPLLSSLHCRPAPEVLTTLGKEKTHIGVLYLLRGCSLRFSNYTGLKTRASIPRTPAPALPSRLRCNFNFQRQLPASTHSPMYRPEYSCKGPNSPLSTDASLHIKFECPCQGCMQRWLRKPDGICRHCNLRVSSVRTFGLL